VLGARGVAEFLEASAARSPEKVALVAGKASLTYAALDAWANRIAHALRARGVARGDRVMVFGDNSAEVAASIWGALKADAAFFVVNAQVKAEKLAYMIDDAAVAAVIADAALGAAWVDACGRAATKPPVLVHGAQTPRALELARAAGVVGAEALAPLVDAQPAEAPARRTVDVDLAAIIYTSGSTGEPKGAMLTHRNVAFASWSVTTLLENTADDVILGVVPMAFNYGLYQWLMTVRLGATLVLERSFTFPVAILKRVAETGVTGFPGVPTMFALLGELKDVGVPPLTGVRYVTSTAAALLPKHFEAIARWFPNAKVYSMYGLTECKRVSWLPPADVARKPGSVGVPIPGTEFWVVDPEGRRSDRGAEGELVVRGSHIMAGYWRKPEITARYLRPGALPGEVLFYTGDYVRLDDDGYLYFIARMDEVIKTRGEKVAPREVEAALERIEGVRECAVVGVPDDILGAAVKAFVVLSDEHRGRYTEKDIALRLGQVLEAYMVPKHVEFRESLPKTAMGKIVKKGLA
jgi:amino acid adenylation domain-containing protein